MNLESDFSFHNSNSSLLSFFKSYKSLTKMPEMGQTGEGQGEELEEGLNNNNNNEEEVDKDNMGIPKHLIQEVPSNNEDLYTNNGNQQMNHHHSMESMPPPMNHSNNNNNMGNNTLNNTQNQNYLPHGNNQIIPHQSSNNPNNSLPNSNNQLNVVSQQNNQIVSDTCSLLTIPPTHNQNIKYVDITEFLSLPQTEAAKKLGLPVSTLSKRWKEAVKERKWPYRKVSKLDKEITTLLYNIPQSGPEAGKLGFETEQKLGRLLRLRQEELKPVVIRI